MFNYVHKLDTPIVVPVIRSKRIAPCRQTPTNRRKIQVKLNEIVWRQKFREKQPTPYRVISIEDCANWRRTWSNKSPSGSYCIYYGLQPLIKTLTGYRAARFRHVSMMNASKYNKRLCNSGWIGHDLDMDEFCKTYAEAQFARMIY